MATVKDNSKYLGGSSEHNYISINFFVIAKGVYLCYEIRVYMFQVNIRMNYEY